MQNYTNLEVVFRDTVAYPTITDAVGKIEITEQWVTLVFGAGGTAKYMVPRDLVAHVSFIPA